MKRVSTSVFVLVIVALAACSQAASPNSFPTATTAVEPTAPATPRPTEEPAPTGSLLDSVLEGLGGRGSLDTLSNFVIDATVMRGATGEGPQPVFEPDAPWSFSAAKELEGVDSQIGDVSPVACCNSVGNDDDC